LSTGIHHGAPGSFKSFTLVQKRAIPALREGRTIVTNIRGFDSVALIEEQLEEQFPESAHIIYIDTDKKENLYLMCRWFHWCPKGAMILIDEAQRVYPMRRDFKIESLDQYEEIEGYPILDDNRPDTFEDAFNMQRHHNWDLYLSTPNIAKINKSIREVSEWAYRHRNISGALPWKKNCWYEHQHDPESNGKMRTHTVGEPVEYKADLRLFNCYSSTQTGNHTESKTGRSILSDPKIKTSFIACAVLLCVSVYLLLSDASGDDSEVFIQDEPQINQVARVSNSKINPTNDNHHTDKSGNNDFFKPYLAENILKDIKIYIKAALSAKGTYKYYLLFKPASGDSYTQTSDNLIELGYTIKPFNSCHAQIQFYDYTRYIYCGTPKENNRATRASGSTTRRER